MKAKACKIAENTHTYCTTSIHNSLDVLHTLIMVSVSSS